MSLKQQRRVTKLNKKGQEVVEQLNEEGEVVEEVDLLEAEEVRRTAESFAEENWKLIAAGILGIILVCAGIFYYTNVHVPNQVKAAANDMYGAQKKFENNEFRVALDGDGSSLGFLEIIDTYGGKASNLAQYYAGISYLNLGEYDNAITHLNNFSSSDVILSAMAKGAKGDALAENGDLDAAISSYKAAAATNPNELSTPYYLMKAGLALESQGKAGEALSLYKEIKAKYPESQQGRDADKLIVRAQAKS